MTPEERAARNIPAGYNDDLPNLSEAEKERCHREREEYMFAKTLQDAGDANSIILICGRLHVKPLAVRFHDTGHTVQTTDVQSQPWYIEDWQTHMIFNL
jgi:hypothetical protein